MHDWAATLEALHDLQALLEVLSDLLDPDSDTSRAQALSTRRAVAAEVAMDAVDYNDVELLKTWRVVLDSAWEALNQSDLAKRATLQA